MSQTKTAQQRAEDAVSQISRYVNGMGREPIHFVTAMSNEHRTLQQSFTKLCMAWLEHLAEAPDYEFDLRNQASRDLAKEIFDKVEYLGLPNI